MNVFDARLCCECLLRHRLVSLNVSRFIHDGRLSFIKSYDDGRLPLVRPFGRPSRHRRQFLALRPLAFQYQSSKCVDGNRFTAVSKRSYDGECRTTNGKPRAFTHISFDFVNSWSSLEDKYQVRWCTVCLWKKMYYSVKRLGMIVCDIGEKKPSSLVDAFVPYWVLEEFRKS